jgi:nuclear GTP-binding protein
VGIIGYPNVGKSSVINTLRRKQVCKVAPIPGETKIWQYVMLTRSIFLIDCPGIVYDREGNNDVQAVLKGVVRVERLGADDKTEVVDTVMQIVKKKDLQAAYHIQEWSSTADFLTQLAVLRGKLLPGGVPDLDIVSRSLLYDWQRGKIPWFNAPPFSSNQECRSTQQLPEGTLMKRIANYSSFNIVEDQLVQNTEGEGQEPKPQQADESEEEEPARAGKRANVGPKAEVLVLADFLQPKGKGQKAAKQQASKVAKQAPRKKASPKASSVQPAAAPGSRPASLWEAFVEQSKAEV